MLKDQEIGKKLTFLVEEQLKYCRSLRQADLMLITQVCHYYEVIFLEENNS